MCAENNRLGLREEARISDRSGHVTYLKDYCRRTKYKGEIAYMYIDDEEKKGKIKRILRLYTKLTEGYVINKAEEAEALGVNEKSIQRDIDDIRGFLDEESLRTNVENTVIYDRNARGYRLETLYKIRLKNSEVLALCKILLDSRAFTKKEMVQMLEKLITCCVPKSNQELVKDLIRNEEYHYVELRHKTKFIDKMWDLGNAIRESRYIEIDYYRTKDKKTVSRKLQPVAIMFSEYYFYLTAFIDDNEVKNHFEVINDPFPTIYRIDRIKTFKVLDDRFRIPYSNRFEEGEFRKRIQFMYGGKLQKVKFKYTGSDIDAILDRLPTAKILDEDEKGYTVCAEVFGKGIDMWLRSQGSAIEMIEYE